MVDGARSTLVSFAAAACSVPDNVVVSPSSAGWISAATTAPVSRSTACSGLYARCVVPSFILAILASGSVHPVRVGELLALAGAIDANKIVGRRRLDPALLGHALQHLPVGLACVPADDRPQRGIGLHRRGVDADPLAVHQTVLGDARQHPANTSSWTSCGRRLRVFDSQEWSGTRSVVRRRRNSLSDSASAQRHSIPRSELIQ